MTAQGRKFNYFKFQNSIICLFLNLATSVWPVLISKISRFPSIGRKIYPLLYFSFPSRRAWNPLSSRVSLVVLFLSIIMIVIIVFEIRLKIEFVKLRIRIQYWIYKTAAKPLRFALKFKNLPPFYKFWLYNDKTFPYVLLKF